MKLPDFLQGVCPTIEDRTELEPHLTNWSKLNAYLRRQTHEEQTLLKLLVLLLERGSKASNMMADRVLARRHTSLRQTEKAQMEFYLGGNK